MATGKPSVTVPSNQSLRALQSAIQNIVTRLKAIETELNNTTLQAGQNTNLIQQTLKALQNAINAIVNPYQGDQPGISIWDGTGLFTRILVAGANISITGPDGQSGNIMISSTAEAGGDEVLYDNIGQAAITSYGTAVIMA
jgi:hypothetical protein